MKKILFIAAFIALGPLFVYMDGTIMSDFKLRGEKLEMANMFTTDRKCTSTAFVFHQCGYKYELNGQETRQNYYFFAFGAPERVFLLRSLDRGIITSTVGQDYFWNRVFTMGLALMFSLVTLIGVLASMMSGNRSATNARVADVRERAEPVVQRRNQPAFGGNGGFGRR